MRRNRDNRTGGDEFMKRDGKPSGHHEGSRASPWMAGRNAMLKVV